MLFYISCNINDLFVLLNNTGKQDISHYMAVCSKFQKNISAFSTRIRLAEVSLCTLNRTAVQCHSLSKIYLFTWITDLGTLPIEKLLWNFSRKWYSNLVNMSLPPPNHNFHGKEHLPQHHSFLWRSIYYWNY